MTGDRKTLSSNIEPEAGPPRASPTTQTGAVIPGRRKMLHKPAMPGLSGRQLVRLIACIAALMSAQHVCAQALRTGNGPVQHGQRLLQGGQASQSAPSQGARTGMHFRDVSADAGLTTQPQ